MNLNEPPKVIRYGEISSPRRALRAAAYTDDENQIPIPVDNFDAPPPVSSTRYRGIGVDPDLGDGAVQAMGQRAYVQLGARSFAALPPSKQGHSLRAC